MKGNGLYSLQDFSTKFITTICLGRLPSFGAWAAIESVNFGIELAPKADETSIPYYLKQYRPI